MYKNNYIYLNIKIKSKKMGIQKQEPAGNFLKILIASDKFKGSLTSAEAAASIKAGIESGFSDNALIYNSFNSCVKAGTSAGPGNNKIVLRFDIVEIADGGDGSTEVVKRYCRGKGAEDCRETECTATGPTGNPVSTAYLQYGRTAFIEMARISGLEMLPEAERNPLYTTTYGLGEVIRHALGRGAEEIILSIGGSATNDGGTGMLQALGFRFYDVRGRLIPDTRMCGKELERIARIEPPSGGLLNCAGERAVLKVICDVTNPLLGVNGATWVYGAQKGASPAELVRLEAGMETYVRAAGSPFAAGLPGAGAAGGMGFAAVHFLNGELISGWRFFAELTGLEERVKEADVVISGEGKIDGQSVQGKVIGGIAELAALYRKPLLLFCGVNGIPATGKELPGVEIYSLSDIEPDIEKSIRNAGPLLSALAERAVRSLCSRFKIG